MIYLNLIIVFILGTIIGSFLNVLVLRYNTGFSFITGRSRCFTCSKYLNWYELIPLFSFLMIGGKCLGCKSKVSYQYPIVEGITGVVFVGVFWIFSLSPLLPIYLIISSLLIAMAVYDYLHKIIPDGMVYSFIFLSFVAMLITHPLASLFSIPLSFDLLAGPILFSFFAILWLVSGGKWMGFGDAKLALGVGFLLGFTGGVYAIMLAFYIGAVFSIVIMILQKLKISSLKLKLNSEVPFAPFIILGLFIELLTSWNILSLFHI